jgi:hypothetical protein
VRCPKNEALSNSTPVTAVTSFESRQVHRSSQVCTPAVLLPPSVQIGGRAANGRPQCATAHTQPSGSIHCTSARFSCACRLCEAVGFAAGPKFTVLVPHRNSAYWPGRSARWKSPDGFCGLRAVGGAGRSRTETSVGRPLSGSNRVQIGSMALDPQPKALSSANWPRARKVPAPLIFAAASG